MVVFHGICLVLGLFHGFWRGSGCFSPPSVRLLRLSERVGGSVCHRIGLHSGRLAGIRAVLAMPWLLSPVLRLAALGVACLAALVCSLRSCWSLAALAARCARWSLRSLKCGSPPGGHQMVFSGAFLAPSRKFLQFETSLLHFFSCNSFAYQ